MASVFDHGLGDKFLKALEEEASTPGWWSDVLADKELLISPRGSYLSVYWKGQAIFTVKPKSSGLSVTTHKKYLIDVSLNGQVALTNGGFDIGKLKDEAFIGAYEGKETLKKLKRAAGQYSGPEKSGCHRVALGCDRLIDVEIALRSQAETEGANPEEEAELASDRIDLATVENHDGVARLVFWEAKDFSNKELRSRSEAVAPVTGQIERYIEHLAKKKQEVEASYPRVASNIVALARMGARRPVNDLIRKVAAREARLTLGKRPRVGLIIFGFDNAQKKDPVWKDHLEKLESAIKKLNDGEERRVVKVGDAKKLTLP